MFLFLMELLKSGSLSLQTVFFAFASRSRYMQVSLFHKYYCTICVCFEPRFQPWVGKILWKRERLPTLVFWTQEFPGLYSPWDGKESDRTEGKRKKKKEKKSLYADYIFHQIHRRIIPCDCIDLSYAFELLYLAIMLVRDL